MLKGPSWVMAMKTQASTRSASSWQASILMFSMAGVPPTVGFWAKLTVLKAVVHIDMLWLALVAVFFSIIGVYYYLRMVKVMYFDQAEDTLPLNKSGDLQVALSANGLVILVLGVYPGFLMALCVSVFT